MCCWRDSDDINMCCWRDSDESENVCFVVVVSVFYEL